MGNREFFDSSTFSTFFSFGYDMSVCVPSSMTTEDLKFHFAEAKDGNQEAYQRLFDLHINQVLQERGFASEQFIYFERDDLLQELYMASWEGFGNLKHFNAFHEWLGTVAMSTYCKMLRQSAPWKKRGILFAEAELDEIPVEERSLLEKLKKEENLNYLDTAIHNLSKDDQNFIDLVYFSGFSQDSVCELLHYTNTSSIRKRRKLVLTQLQFEFERLAGEKISIRGFNCLFAYLGTNTIGCWATMSEGRILSTCLAALKSLGTKAMFLTAIPLIWLTAVMICGNRVIATVVNQPSHIANRLWLIKRAFFGYCFVVLTPAMLFTGLQLGMNVVFLQGSRNLRSCRAGVTTLVVLGVAFLLFCIVSRFQYKRISSQNERLLLSTDQIAKSKRALQKLVKVGSMLVGICILAATVNYVFGLYLYFVSPKYNLNFLIKHNLADFLQVTTIYLGYHLFSFFFFRKMVTDTSTECMSSSLMLSKGEHPVQQSITSAFMFATLFIPAADIIFLHRNPMISLYKLILFIILWTIVFFVNKKGNRFWFVCFVFIPSRNRIRRRGRDVRTDRPSG